MSSPPLAIQISDAVNVRATGLAGLDDILNGGLITPSVSLIEGLPGTGKTILASQLAYLAAQDESRETLYISFEMSKPSFATNFVAFGWTKTLPNLRFWQATIEEFIESVNDAKFDFGGAKSVVVDCLTPVCLSFDNQGAKAYRHFLQTLFTKFRDAGILAFVITETQPSRILGETGAGPEHFLADSVLTLRKAEQRRALLRSIEIAKSRGQKVVTGRHSLQIEDGSGIAIYPRAYAKERVPFGLAVSSEREKFGLPGLEEMLGGGVFKGSSTFVVGISGTGKTVSAFHFLNEGLQRGENVMLVSLEESADQFCRNASQLGFSFDQHIAEGRLLIIHELPLEIELDAHFARIADALKTKKVSRIVLDSIATYEVILPEESHEFLLALTTLVRDTGVTSLFAYECDELLGVSQISQKLKISALADNIILLNYVEISTTLRRALTVPKARGSSPDHQTKEYVIRRGGIAILDESTVPTSDQVPQLPLSCYYGVLARSPTRHSPIIDESVAAGKPMPKSKRPKPIKKNEARPSVN